MVNLRYVIFLFFIPFVLHANPFDKYEKELDEWKESHSRSISTNRSEIGKISKLFATGNFSPNEETEILDPMGDLPKYLKFSTIVSSRIVNEKGIVVKNHTVKVKDTLSSIARTYNTTVATIKSKNGLKTDIIRLGDVLEIPVVTGNASRKKIVTERIFINPVPGSRISSSYGRRKDPFNKFSKNFHSGLDLAAPLGTPIMAASDGEVVFTGKNGGYGNTVILLHENGYKTVYAHCAKIVVNVGEKVKMGRVIAAVGRTGTATGAHLHFEVHKNGKLYNPSVALRTYKKVITNLPTKVAGI
ncbi:MAG: LysM peptidoglycan-binding domain-containing M23 family metallopeptidase [Leptospira sp.]|nr:LysM peptidoglycan-binding domain-containing M23 family metallopeptidase [Leptospira sp.]